MWEPTFKKKEELKEFQQMTIKVKVRKILDYFSTLKIEPSEGRIIGRLFERIKFIALSNDMQVAALSE